MKDIAIFFYYSVAVCNSIDKVMSGSYNIPPPYSERFITPQ